VTGPSLTNAISFDLEHWHTATLVQEHISNPTNHVVDSVKTVLDLLSRSKTRATFFIVGELASEYPDLIQHIREAGHELGIHGHTHTPLFDLTPDEFTTEVAEAIEAIENATGITPAGFRAPNFSLTEETKWALPILNDSELAYDSSLFPVKTPLYGVAKAPLEPFNVDRFTPFELPEETKRAYTLKEFPLSTLVTPVRAPIAGGFYARVAPLRFLTYGITHLNRRGLPANLYFHPWEFNPAVKSPELPLHKRFVSNYGIDSLEAKVEHLLETFNFGTVEATLNSYFSTDSERPDAEQHAEKRSLLSLGGHL